MTRHWEPGVAYSTGEVVEFRDHKYKVVQGHTSQSDWTPGPSTAALFQSISSDEHREPCHERAQEPPVFPAPCHTIDSERSLADSSASVPVHAQNAESPKQHSFTSRDAWLQDARNRTDEFNRSSFRAPVAWVLVKGREIPENALEAGVEADKFSRLFVARAYVEDGLYLGKAGKHLRHGAEIGRDNVCHPIQEYEILIGDPRGVRWVDAKGVPNPKNFGGRPVDAGVDAYGHHIFIVRVSHKGGVHPARASGGASGAYVAYGNGELVFQEYRVLCYA